MANPNRWVDPLERWQGRNAALSDDDVLRAKKVFAVYAGSEAGVPVNALVTLLRAMGLTPSFLDMRDVHKKLGTTPSLTFQQFLDVYAAERKVWDTMDDVMNLLKSFDHNGDGTIDSNEMVSALTTLGDTLTEAQCAKLTALADGRGRISTAVLAKYLLAQ